MLLEGSEQGKNNKETDYLVIYFFYFTVTGTVILMPVLV
jgi:hypothetical protein